MTDGTSGRPVKEYKPKHAKYNGRVLLDRRKPFELWLKIGGGIFAFHFQIHKLTITWESGKLRKYKEKK